MRDMTRSHRQLLFAYNDPCGKAAGQTNPSLMITGFERELLMLAADILIDITASDCASKSFTILRRSTVPAQAYRYEDVAVHWA